MKIVDYGYIVPGSKMKQTAEDRERVKKMFAELSSIAKAQGVIFLLTKAPIENGETNDRS